MKFKSNNSNSILQIFPQLNDTFHLKKAQVSQAIESLLLLLRLQWWKEEQNHYNPSCCFVWSTSVQQNQCYGLIFNQPQRFPRYHRKSTLRVNCNSAVIMESTTKVHPPPPPPSVFSNSKFTMKNVRRLWNSNDAEGGGGGSSVLLSLERVVELPLKGNPIRVKASRDGGKTAQRSKWNC